MPRFVLWMSNLNMLIQLLTIIPSTFLGLELSSDSDFWSKLVVGHSCLPNTYVYYDIQTSRCKTTENGEFLRKWYYIFEWMWILQTSICCMLPLKKYLERTGLKGYFPITIVFSPFIALIIFIINVVDLKSYDREVFSVFYASGIGEEVAGTGDTPEAEQQYNEALLVCHLLNLFTENIPQVVMIIFFTEGQV